MAENDLGLIAHLMRRAGFGATRAELAEYAARGYEAVVEELLHPERSPGIDEDILQRYWDGESINVAAGAWLYRMINSRRPLEEKIALFWHYVFATAWYKSEHVPSMVSQIAMFRRIGLTNLRTILLELSRDPAMIYWLDNNENRKGEPNENYGRELLELFSMGVGNYSETDIKMAARAFTGWTFRQPIPLYPYGFYPAEFVYRADDHDDGVKTFLGHTGRLGGEDIVDIIVQQPATARFVARHLYNFFVADEPQVPAWYEVPPQDPAAIQTLVRAYVDSGGDVRAMLRVLFNAEFFKAARSRKLKSPAELVVGTVKLVGTHRFPEAGLLELEAATIAMGQQIMNPPTVEGWHTGKEWIDGGTLNERVNFAVNQLADPEKPGLQEIVGRLSARAGASGGALSPEQFVDGCLELVGPLELGGETRRVLLDAAASDGALGFASDEERRQSAARVSRMLQLVVASREYQLA
ncbi:MAG TPA: DUF1800 domain-containing protein [Chloroflexota bacterium]|nr:DUF1800 domain-containing protein [Chloroflexota bacterium]